MKEKRIVNVRLLFVALVGIISGILFAYLTIKSVNLSYFSAYLVPFGLLMMVAIVFSFFKLYKGNNRVINRINKYFSSTIAFILLFIVGAGVTALKLVNYLNLTDYTEDCNIQLQVSDVHEHTNYANIVTNSFSVNGTKVNQKATVVVYLQDSDSLNIKPGQTLSFTSSARLLPLFDTTSNLVDYLYGRAYTLNVNIGDITTSKGSFRLDQTIRSHVYNVLSSNINEDNAGIAYAMLFGDKEHISQDITQMFSYTGISHILAVSGLHVTLVAGMIAYLLKKLKAKRIVNLIVVSTTLLVYCYLCGFSPSVVRVSIMSVIVLVAYVSGKEYDILSALSLAAIITLLINPLNLFATGFQLSYLCLLSIITLSNSITRVLAKLKLPTLLCKTFAISICINLVILPICANAFSRVSIIGAITNVFVLPLFGVTYPILFVFTLISSIMPFMGFTLFVPNVLLHFIKLIANFFASINFMNFKLYHISYLIVITIILTLLVIKYIMVKPKLKGIIVGVLVVTMLTTFGINMISKSYDGVFALSYQYSSNSAVITINGENYLVGTKDKYIATTLKKLKIRTIDYIIGYDVDLNGLDDLGDICHTYNVQKVYVPSTLPAELSSKYNYGIIYTDNVGVGNYTFSFVYDSTDSCVGLMVNSTKKVVFVNPSNTNEDNIQLLNNVTNIDYLVCNTIKVNAGLLEDVSHVIAHNSATGKYTSLYKVECYLL